MYDICYVKKIINFVKSWNLQKKNIGVGIFIKCTILSQWFIGYPYVTLIIINTKYAFVYKGTYYVLVKLNYCFYNIEVFN